MKMRVMTVALIAGLLIGGSTLIASDLKSGPQVGEKISAPPHYPLTVFHAEKPDREGKKMDFVEEYGGNPVLVIFARTFSDALAKLVTKLDAELAKQKQGTAKRAYAILDILSDDEDLEGQLKKFGEKQRIKHIRLAIDWNETTPKEWKLAKDADITVILYNRRKVEANHAFRKGGLNDRNIEIILADVPNLFAKAERKRHGESVVSTKDAPPKHPDEVEADGLMVKRSEVVGKKPTADLGVARVWTVEKGKEVRCLFVEVSGTVPMHFHPDGVHRMYVIEGKLRMTIGKETMEMEPGDFMMIPRGVRHKVERIGEGKAYFATVDSPPIDPRKIVWIEPAPKK